MSNVKINKFGTFGGVFTPSILTIFGLIMFMRSNYVMGNAGVFQSFIILTISSGITFLTALSISAISSNTPVSSGGAYFLISRVLGPGFGTAIGIALFMAQAISIPFYILGFVEAYCNTFQEHAPYYSIIAFGTLFVLFVLTWIGTGGIIKIQYFLLAALLFAIGTFLYNSWQGFSNVTFDENLHSHYDEGLDIWTMFAIYFPAVTGIMAGVNMSGDLKDPKKSIPKGTLWAVGLGFVVYAIQIILSSGAFDAETLKSKPFEILVTSSGKLGFMVIAGVFIATLSSAIGSYLGAPRVLQALSADETIKFLRPFGKVTAKGEPRNALIVSFFIGVLVIKFAGDGTDMNGLNMVAEIVSMVFLYTYGMTNLAAFVESSGANPSFRPKFRFFHWSTALIGAIGCLWTAFMINPTSAGISLALIAILYYMARRNQAGANFSDARRGFIYSRVSRNMQLLHKMEETSKNWRPTLLVFVGVLNKRVNLVKMAKWLGNDSGIVSLASVISGPIKESMKKKEEAQEQLEHFIDNNKLGLYPEVVIMEDFDKELGAFIQGHSLSPIKPNIILFGWPTKTKRLHSFYSHMRTVRDLDKNFVAMVDRGFFLKHGSKKYIDCWWRGCENGSLMVMLAYLVSQSDEWENTTIRLIRIVSNEAEREANLVEMEQMALEARIEVEPKIIISEAAFPELLTSTSKESQLVVMGLDLPKEGAEEKHYSSIETLLKHLPTTLLVKSTGDVDLSS